MSVMLMMGTAGPLRREPPERAWETLRRAEPQRLDRADLRGRGSSRHQADVSA